MSTNTNEKTTEIKTKSGKLDLKSMRDRDRQLVKGKFIFHEIPGGTLKFPFRAHEEDGVEKYELQDGQIYELPLGVARHLNKNCWYPVHQHLQDENGAVSQRVGQKIRRTSFQSLEFIDNEDLTPEGTANIVTVENAGKLT